MNEKIGVTSFFFFFFLGRLGPSTLAATVYKKERYRSAFGYTLFIPCHFAAESHHHLDGSVSSHSYRYHKQLPVETPIQQKGKGMLRKILADG